MMEPHVLGEPTSTNFTPQTAGAVERAYVDRKIRLLGVFLPIGIALLLAFAPWDYAISPETAPSTVRIRLLLSVLLLVLWLGRSSGFVRKWHDWLVCMLIAVTGSGIAAVLSLVPGGFGAASGGIALVIMFGAGAVGMRASQTVLASVIIIAATVLLMLRGGESATMVVSIATMLASFGALGAAYNAANRRDVLDVLSSQSRLRAEKQQSDALLREITTMRAQRLKWLEGLADFLRHELNNQIVAVSTSIDLAQSDGSRFGNRTYLERAQRSLGRMRGLVSSATEATSLEAALAADEMGRVDLSALVAERVLLFQQLHPSRQLLLGLKPGLFVHGNEERLAQLFDKLLNNAVEHSAPDAEIRVALRRINQGSFEFSVENEGDPLPADKLPIFEAFVSSQSRPENLGLGLYVAQTIARNHRGHITAEDLSESLGARFVVQLPELIEETRTVDDEQSRRLASGRAPLPVAKTQEQL